MTRILDIDMDFFLNKIAEEKIGKERLNAEEYYPWKEKEFREFLEEKCNLSKENKIMGKIIEEHDEAFYFWKDLIEKKKIVFPFGITHIDAHSDLKNGCPREYFKYLLGELLHMPMSERIKNLDTSTMGSANYLAFAIACGFFNKVDLVLHPAFFKNEHFRDIPACFFKNDNHKSGSLEMKAYSDFEISYGILEKAVFIDEEIPFQMIQPKEYKSQTTYDYLVFCQSPAYTPETADFMLDVIKDYIVEIE